MRIRQVRPEFWTDEVIAALPIPARFFYIGLWNVADDAGWMEWRVSRIGAVLFPYEPTRRRERDIEGWAMALIDAERLVMHDCGCAEIPTLARHQRITGKQSFSALDRHKTHGVERVIPPTLRDSILARDGYQCRMCGRDVTPRTLVLAHVDPTAPSVIDNLVVGCRRCNYRQGNKQLADVGMKLLDVPVAPRRYQVLSDSPVTERNVKERNVMSVDELNRLRDTEDEADRQKLAATGRLRR